jgi:hypothetical protein
MITRELKNICGFKGLCITDGLGMTAVDMYHQKGYKEYLGFYAGNDILLCPTDVPHAIHIIEDALDRGIISENRLNHSVQKILAAKYWISDIYKKHQDRNLSYLTRPYAKSLQQRLYDESITTHNFKKHTREHYTHCLHIHIGDPPYDTLEEYAVICNYTCTDIEHIEKYLVTHPHITSCALHIHKNIDIYTQKILYEYVSHICPYITTIAYISSDIRHTIYKKYPLIIAYEDNIHAYTSAMRVFYHIKQATGQYPLIQNYIPQT